jgi:hypothetical protein
MPPVGLEPTHTRHEFLKLACLPIPSQGLLNFFSFPSLEKDLPYNLKLSQQKKIYFCRIILSFIFEILIFE